MVASRRNGDSDFGRVRPEPPNGVAQQDGQVTSVGKIAVVEFCGEQNLPRVGVERDQQGKLLADRRIAERGEVSRLVRGVTNGQCANSFIHTIV